MLTMILVFLAGLYLGVGACYATFLYLRTKRTSPTEDILCGVFLAIIWPIMMLTVRDKTKDGIFPRDYHFTT
jgi:hypothetical protein